jgi:hypothetical protein
LRRIDDGETLTVDYCGAFGNCSTRLRREHLLRSKLFVCECTACASADVTRRFPCPACCPRGEDGLLRRLDAGSPGLTEAQPTVVPRARGRGCAWVCDGCQRQFSDRDVDRPVHLGAVNRMPQLHAARTLFAAERLLESAVHNLLVHSSRQSDRLRCSAPTSAHAHTRTARSHAYTPARSNLTRVLACAASPTELDQPCIDLRRGETASLSSGMAGTRATINRRFRRKTRLVDGMDSARRRNQALGIHRAAYDQASHAT